MTLRNDIVTLLASVEHVTGLLEVIFHHVDVVIVIFEVNTGVPDQKNAEFVKTFGYFLTLETDLVTQLVHVFSVASFKVDVHVDNWNILEIL
jgi:hypothetical protein